MTVSNDDTWRKEWHASAALRAEFADDLDCYLAFRRAEAAGAVHFVRGRTVTISRAESDAAARQLASPPRN
ncbi:MAG: hypothetical protein R3D51_19445 [Hyphomicrobiaceae bacterium]